MRTALKGLIAAPFTPLQPDGSLNLDMIPRQANALVQDGVSGVFICGTTGEGLSLSTEERIQVADRWATASDKLRVIVHVGHESIAESRRLAIHAAQIKTAAIAAVGPAFYGVGGVSLLADHCAQIAEAAPALPFYYYHIPMMTGVDLPMCDFLHVAVERIPTFAGIKFTHENLMDYRRCLDFAGDRLDILFGRDEMLLAALALGATAAVGSTYNFMAPLYLDLMKAFHSANFESARKLQSQAIEVIALLSRHGGLPAAKAVMKLIGLDCGPVRSPLPQLSPAALQTLERELYAAGFPHAQNHFYERKP